MVAGKVVTIWTPDAADDINERVQKSSLRVCVAGSTWDSSRNGDESIFLYFAVVILKCPHNLCVGALSKTQK